MRIFGENLVKMSFLKYNRKTILSKTGIKRIFPCSQLRQVLGFFYFHQLDQNIIDFTRNRTHKVEY